MSECKHETWNSVSTGLKWACGECGKFESVIIEELRQQLAAEQAKRIAWELSAERAEAAITTMRSSLERIKELSKWDRGLSMHEGTQIYAVVRESLSNTAGAEYVEKIKREAVEEAKALALAAVSAVRLGLGAGGHGSGMYMEVATGNVVLDCVQDAIDERFDILQAVLGEGKQ